MKRIFDDDMKFNPIAWEYVDMVKPALRDVFQKALENEVNLRDLSHVLIGELLLTESEFVMHYEFKRQRTVKGT